MKKILIITTLSSFGLIACSTTETSRTIQSPQVTAATATTKYTGVKLLFLLVSLIIALVI